MSVSKRQLGVRGWDRPAGFRVTLFEDGSSQHVIREFKGRCLVFRRRQRQDIAGRSCVDYWQVGQEFYSMPGTLSPRELLEKARRPSAPRPSSTGESSSGVLGECPVVRAFMQEPLPGGGPDRSVGTLLFFWADGVWKACLSDREAGRAVWGQGEAIEQAVIDIEERLQAGTAEWRKDKQKTFRKG